MGVEQLADITTIRCDDISNQKEVIRTLADNMRKIDEYECIAMGAMDGYHGLLLSLSEKDSLSYIGLSGDVPVWAYGILKSPVPGLGHCIWFLGTDAVDTYKRYFVIESMATVRKWQHEYGQLWNAVSKDNKKAIRWLKWLGATFEPLKEVEGFLLFTLPSLKERT